ncbi:MAG: hypothetical protein ACXW32_13640 [Limisphaerales bacterium]
MDRAIAEGICFDEPQRPRLDRGDLLAGRGGSVQRELWPNARRSFFSQFGISGGTNDDDGVAFHQTKGFRRGL